MISPAAAVLDHGPAEFRHRHDDDVLHAITEIASERGDAGGEIVEPRCKLTGRAALVGVMVPVTGFGERNLEAYIRLRQLRDLPQRLAEGGPRIYGAVCGRILLRVRCFHHVNGFEGFAPGRLEHAVRGARVLILERGLRARGFVPRTNTEAANLADRECGFD